MGRISGCGCGLWGGNSDWDGTGMELGPCCDVGFMGVWRGGMDGEKTRAMWKL